MPGTYLRGSFSMFAFSNSAFMVFFFEVDYYMYTVGSQAAQFFLLQEAISLSGVSEEGSSPV
jgi:hypothetical protein